jgi:hypothetical protein
MRTSVRDEMASVFGVWRSDCNLLEGNLKLTCDQWTGLELRRPCPARSHADERVRFQDNAPNLREGYGHFQPVYNTPARAHCR